MGDPTLLFTNAGMNQFKDVFLGLEQRDYKRATSAQKCVRAGGKHNDLENVGFTNRHHTFFEMLGNFSFGDYFKKDAIAFAWELVTSRRKLVRHPARQALFHGFWRRGSRSRRDAGHRRRSGCDLWVERGRAARSRDRGSRPEGEFLGHGRYRPLRSVQRNSLRHGPGRLRARATPTAQFGCECGRYVEIWNLVFMQFNRDAAGNVAPLPKPSIDTGAGLERLAAVLQGKDQQLRHGPLSAADRFCQQTLRQAVWRVRRSPMRPCASSRTTAAPAAFLIGDGVMPSNEGRGYVLRKIIRRAVRHGRMLGIERPFLFEMAKQVAEEMREPYPELLESHRARRRRHPARRGALRAHHRHRPDASWKRILAAA